MQPLEIVAHAKHGEDAAQSHQRAHRYAQVRQAWRARSCRAGLGEVDAACDSSDDRGPCRSHVVLRYGNHPRKIENRQRSPIDQPIDESVRMYVFFIRARWYSST